LLARIERARPAGDSQPTPGNPIAAAKAAEPKKAEHADDAQGAAH
jgi:NADH-quinone oxidoreductase subunit M